MASAAVLYTGNSVVTAASSRGPGVCVAVDADRELIENGDFETGQLSPWTTSAWIVDTKFPHGGTYCASVVGNQWIRQFIDTVPASEIQSITFWSRQPDQPAAQAYDFFYSDGSFEEFVHFPQPDWRQFDVTANLNRAKSLVGLGIWGYSGGGPGPDSTYLDDVSIQVAGQGPDIQITAILSPRDTIPFGQPNTPEVVVANHGTTADSFSIVAMVEDICDPDPYYWDTVATFLPGGCSTNVQFEPWNPRYPSLHRISIWLVLEGNSNNDTVRHFFWVRPGVGVAEEPTGGVSGTAHVTATITRGVLHLPATGVTTGQTSVTMLDAAGRRVLNLRPGLNDVRRLAPGVYLVVDGNHVNRAVVVR
jgi:hypothetical protein